MGSTTVWEVLLLTGSAAFASVVALGRRQPKDELGHAVSLIAAVAIFLIAAIVWATTGKGVVEHGICSICPSCYACRNHPETPGPSDFGRSGAVEAPQKSSTITSNEVRRPESDEPESSPPPVPSKALSADVVEVPALPSPVIERPRYPSQAFPARDGAQITLESLVDFNDRYNGKYIATLSINNATQSDIGVALWSSGASEADLFLTDGVGGSCQMIANGEGWGTLNSYLPGAIFSGPANFSMIPAGGSVRHTLFFNKGRCDVLLSADSGLSITGRLALLIDGSFRSAPFSFHNLPLYSR